MINGADELDEMWAKERHSELYSEEIAAEKAYKRLTIWLQVLILLVLIAALGFSVYTNTNSSSRYVPTPWECIIDTHTGIEYCDGEKPKDIMEQYR